MISFFPTLRLAAAILLTVLVIPAQAAWVPHAFTVSISSLLIYDPANDASTFPESSTFAGPEVAIGDEVFGIFYYESDTPAAFTFPVGNGSFSFYLPTTSDHGSFFFVARTGLSAVFGASPTAVNITSVTDNNDLGWDIFSTTQNSEPGGEFAQSAHLGFFDFGGTALSGTSLPSELRLSDWGQATFSSYWTRASDGVQFGISGNITSLDYLAAPVPVPEPFSLGLFALAGAAAFAARKQRAA